MVIERGFMVVATLSALVFCATFSFADDKKEDHSASDSTEDGSVHVSAFDLPLSGFLSDETRAVLRRQKQQFEEYEKVCPYRPPESVEDVISQRRCGEQHYYPAIIARLRERYKVAIEPKIMAGVATEILTPHDGIPAANRDRVLINLHGGSFMYGGRWGGQVESIPIAALGKIKIVSVDYRMAPEHRFPAASEDVAAVYKALLADYRPEHIGIYGCSAGGFITAQAVVWLQKAALPLPGAIGLFCAGALPSGGGDSEHLWAAISGARSVTSDQQQAAKKLSYFSDADLKDPLAFPGLDPRVLGRFPDTLLITSTRDFLLSSVVETHAELVKLGVQVELHVWEGLDHAFFFEPDLPESREVYDVIVRFFAAHLGDR